ncbi:MAG TPA: ABC transporter substrate binding protein [Bradyrhizobium sp.]
MIERRAFVIALGTNALVAPLFTQAQQPAKPVLIGWLSGSSPETAGYLGDVFKQRLGELGYLEGRDAVYEIRWARGKADRFPEFAKELVALKPDVILATGGRASVLAVQEATRDIPIVAINLGDPVASDLAKSLARPGGRPGSS